ncbi:short-chain type dehydrogenase/reductase [Mycobacteroides abscessus 4S-0726-RB]|nr:short-chain type dehydrogenase/reductase [Mycobacteroides abscessus 4S-0303]EIT91192.1 short-chain type dehydrogenase/reductase [Mycobacteroides abscessus 4S-0726-RB]EIT94741.1 short-chain type dehydrogenase/reductase [Mycobacteroides abscessus 4S-0726-RA]EIV07250.1 short-chain type dehydrogenase/reductase [Mycobacteroides abscessus 4S-0206]EIV48189.1 short-chain type dehydrogenase/reductase [Mycobacteroides abscessus 4S-0116-R]EIV59174.1 short-chain type dehydrogenase/reductase [Mycobacter
MLNTTKEYRAQMLSEVRSTRLGAPEDTAALIAFLMSDDGAWINGQTILIDGGANLH